MTSSVPSGKRLHSYGKSLFLMGKSTISMAIFNSYVKLPEGISSLNLSEYLHGDSVKLVYAIWCFIGCDDG